MTAEHDVDGQLLLLCPRYRAGVTLCGPTVWILGIESFGREDDPLVLLAGGTTMLSWPDVLCERLASGGRRVVGCRGQPARTRLRHQRVGWSIS